MAHTLHRRDLLRSAAALAALPALGSWPSMGPRASKGWANDRLRTAHIGVGGMGGADLGAIASHPRVEVAALCDVDAGFLERARQAHPGATPYRDYRELLAALGDTIDAVVVSTPDHTHAPAALGALVQGKPVYCQKPLTHRVWEARRLREEAATRGVPTQMGIQIQSHAVYRRALRIVQDGMLGKVSRVYAWSNKNWGYDGPRLVNASAPPESLDWDLWLASAAQRPYVPGVYHPGQWRKLLDFGTGTLGDMGVHIFATPFLALDLGAPSTVATRCRPPTGYGHPERVHVEYSFPGTRYTTDTLTWIWSDGGDAVPTPAELGLPDDTRVPGQGSCFIGEEGTLLLPHIAEGQLYPVERFADRELPVVTEGNHYHEWVDACLGDGHTVAGFDIAGRLTEALLLGVVAARFPDRSLRWDAGSFRFPDVPEATPYLRGTYRPGFGGPGL